MDSKTLAKPKNCAEVCKGKKKKKKNKRRVKNNKWQMGNVEMMQEMMWKESSQFSKVGDK